MLLLMHVCLQKYHYTSQHVQLETTFHEAGIELHATLGYALVHILGVGHTSKTNHIVSMHI